MPIYSKNCEMWYSRIQSDLQYFMVHMHGHKITLIISLQFFYIKYFLFYSALKYLSVCNLTCIYIHILKNHRHRSVTNSNKAMALLSILNLLFCPRLLHSVVSFNVVIKGCNIKMLYLCAYVLHNHYVSPMKWGDIL